MRDVRDPWFQATTLALSELQLIDGSVYNISLYNPDAVVSVAACAEQHQLRNPVTGATSPLGGQEIVTLSQAQKLGFNDEQIAVFNRSFFIAAYSTLNILVEALGGSRLLAANSQYNTQSTYLADNQWALEFEHYFGIALNTVQLWALQYVSGPIDMDMNHFINRAGEGFPQEMCTNQIVRRTGYRSFSMLGLGIVFAFGCAFVLINLTIGSIMEKIQRRTIGGRYRNAEWHANDLLQLQRMAYEHSNVGTWTGQHDMVPRTNADEYFTLPKSTKWDQEIPESPRKDEYGVFQSLGKAWSHHSNKSQSLFNNKSSLSLDKEGDLTPTIDEKGVRVSEIEVKE